MLLERLKISDTIYKLMLTLETLDKKLDANFEMLDGKIDSAELRLEEKIDDLASMIAQTMADLVGRPEFEQELLAIYNRTERLEKAVFKS